LENTAKELGAVDFFEADLSLLLNVIAFADAVTSRYGKLDVLINNAGVYVVDETRTKDGLDVRFAVNTLAPYLLTKLLLSLFGREGRVVNLSSAAQSPVNLASLRGETGRLTDDLAYAQSKLALPMWSRALGLALKESGLSVIAVNPASMLGSKMVRSLWGKGRGPEHRGGYPMQGCLVRRVF
jgi:NAD(P)-dependent dehydrogenase (short-subunit alcohol dehydrogenase family)